MRESLRSLRAKLERLGKKAFRDAFVRANIEQGIAHQIRIQRQVKKWSQKKLASKIGEPNQSAIARLEDPSYGRLTLTTLLKLAAAFDVALLVKFVPYSRLLTETADLSPGALRARSFEEEYTGTSLVPSVQTAIEQSGNWAAISGEPVKILDPLNIPAPTGSDLIAKISIATATGASQWLQ